MLDVGAIRRSNSPWASPVVLVRKKDGSLRFCIDLRKLNVRTVKDAYSLPRIEDALDSLNGACIFTSLDLKSGYWQVELDESSIPLTAFTVGPLGFYECIRMPFGLTNAPLTYILSTMKLDEMGHRWVASLGPYNFKLHYKPGKLNTDVDSLSRINLHTIDPTQVRATMDLAQVDRAMILDPEVKGQQTVECSFPNKSLQLNLEIQKWKRRQADDPEIGNILDMIQQGSWSSYKYTKLDDEAMKCYVKVRNDLEIENELLYHQVRLKDQEEDTYQFVVPRKFRLLALELLHDRFGHLGIDRTTILATGRFYWPHMTEEIRNYIQNCGRCIRFKQRVENLSLKPLQASSPLELIHMDFLRIGSKDDKNANVLVITDHFTRYAEAYVTGNQQASTAAKVFMDKFVTNYGYPPENLN